MTFDAEKHEAATEWLEALRDSADVYDYVAQASGWTRTEVLLFAMLNRLQSIDDAAHSRFEDDDDDREKEPWER